MGAYGGLDIVEVIALQQVPRLDAVVAADRIDRVMSARQRSDGRQKDFQEIVVSAACRLAARASAPQPLADHNRLLADDFAAVVVDPRENDLARLHGLETELDERVFRNCRLEIRREDFLAVYGAGKSVQNLARDDFSLGVSALSRFHHVLNEGLNLNNISSSGFLLVELDARFDGHGHIPFIGLICWEPAARSATAAPNRDPHVFSAYIERAVAHLCDGDDILLRA